MLVERLTPIDPDARDQLLRSIGQDGAHAAAVASLAALHQVELGGAPDAAVPTDELRVVAWNLERGAHLDTAIEVLAAHGPDVVLATELDVGMARSGNRHTVAEIAEHLGHGYAYAVEFIELGLGDAAEVERLGAGARNDHGFHGNAITSRVPLEDPLLIRIEADGSWFNHETDQPRVGGRMALAARIELSGRPVVVCSVHLESESDPELRADQLSTVFASIDERYGAVASVVGGDLNTFSTTLTEVRSRFGELRDEDPSRYCWPIPYEPLFDAGRRHGFDHEEANPAEQTMRQSADQRPGSLLRLDWLLVRDLEVTDRLTIPALDAHQTVISDHDAVCATVRHRA